MKFKAPLPSKEPIDHYASYRYFEVPTAYTTDENFSRARRTIAFADTTKLTPIEVKEHDVTVQKLIKKVSSAVHTDHVSAWKSQKGTLFVLNEPYENMVKLNFGQALGAQGLIYITVPTDLSPYCGKWDDTPGALPWTKSYLICEKAHQVELNAIETALNVASKTAQAWNFV